jgi:RHS repeat-associated protein
VRVYSASSFGRVARVSTDESLTYNAANEMNSAAGVNYTYDGDGQRVEKSSGTLYWYGPGGEVLDETDLKGNLTSEYVYFNGRRIARRNASGSVYYYAGDFLGSARAMVTSSGAKCYDADFYPFGGERDLTNTCPQNYKFTGKERDTETGNDYFGARYYASNFGRFLSPDWSAIPAPVPYANLTNPQTLNLYAIVRDNPETFADLDGHCNADGVPDCKPDATTSNNKVAATGEDGSVNPGDGTKGSPTQQAQNPTTDQIRTELSNLAAAYGVPAPVVLAVAGTESNFDVNSVNTNKNKKGQITSTDYGLMQVNSKNIGKTVTGPDGKSFTITDAIKTDWMANANVGTALVAQEYKAALRSQPDGTAQTLAQQAYSGYNAGPGGRNRYTRTGPFGGFADKRDRNFLNNYLLETTH